MREAYEYTDLEHPHRSAYIVLRQTRERDLSTRLDDSSSLVPVDFRCAVTSVQLQRLGYGLCGGGSCGCHVCVDCIPSCKVTEECKILLRCDETSFRFFRRSLFACCSCMVAHCHLLRLTIYLLLW